MKRILIVLLFSFIGSFLLANGMLIMDAVAGSYMNLTKCKVDIQISNQAAVTTTTMNFYNQTNVSGAPKFAFPLTDNASATKLCWMINDSLYQAVIAPGQQGSIAPPGQTINAYIDQHLGKSPVVFSIPQTAQPAQTIMVQLTYVQLLPYSNGTVTYKYLTDYGFLNQAPLDSLSVNVQIYSPRIITGLQIPDFSSNPVLNGTSATCNFTVTNFIPNRNVLLNYTLAMENLGIGSISTLVNHTNVPDNLGDGFFLALVEPEPTGEVIQKYFTFIIDRSSIMMGTRLEQAKNAASYMINNLNPEDYFNIVDFSTIASAFAIQHMPYNITNRDLALNYISHLDPDGFSNFSGAFDTAIPQFASADSEAASIIVFLTGSQANTGITVTTQLVNHINGLIDATGRNISLFCFGVGSSINFQLLSLIASQNNGTATSVGINNLQDVLVDFFAKVRNPIVLSPTVSFNGVPSPVTEVYPNPLTNLYLGQQMLICGRYSVPQNILLNIDGTAYGNPVNYSFSDTLAESDIFVNVFLMKIWAKLKIEYLLRLYYQLNPESPEALALKTQIETLSIDYGVLCDLTNFSGPTETDDPISPLYEQTVKFIGNYPNPFNPQTSIQFDVKTDIPLSIEIRIYNLRGQLIRTLTRNVRGKGSYQLIWDGKDNKGNNVSSGIYFFSLIADNCKITSKMVLMK